MQNYKINIVEIFYSFLKRTGYIFLLYFCLDTSDAFCANEIKTYLAKPVITVPKIDGVINEDCWQCSEKLTGFSILCESGKIAANQTVALILHDDNFLYLGIKCMEPVLKGLIAKKIRHDDDLWEDDSIEVFLAPSNGKNKYFHFVVNSRGISYDAQGFDRAYNPSWQTKVKVGENFWTVEIAIPFSALAARPKKGDLWGLNIARNRFASKEHEVSVWSGADAKMLHCHEKFGYLIFDSYSACLKKKVIPEYIETGKKLNPSQIQEFASILAENELLLKKEVNPVINHEEFLRFFVPLKTATLFLRESISSRDTIHHTNKLIAKLTTELPKSTFTFVVFGDSQPPVFGEPRAETFHKMLDEINSLNPDFIITTGDIVAIPSAGLFEEYLTMTQKLKPPFFMLMGNHDANINLWQTIIQQELYYSFNYQNAHFIMLNCYLPEQMGKITGNQFNWLRKDLEENGGKDFIFIFLHEPLFPCVKKDKDCLAKFPAERDKLVNLLRRYSQKLTIFCGHEHIYNKTVKNGLTQIISGGGGGILHAPADNGGFHHYLYVSVKDKDFKIAIIKPGNIFSDKPEEKARKSSIITPRRTAQFYVTGSCPLNSPPEKNGRKWYETGYDISGWDTGYCPMGFGNEPKAKFRTKLKNNNGSYFFRGKVIIQDIEKIQYLILKVATDNAAIVYLNGLEIDKDPLFEDGSGHDFSYWNRIVELDTSLWKNGENTIAVNLYNNHGSSDAYLDIEVETVLKH